VFTDDCDALSRFFYKPATVLSSGPTQIVVSVPSADSPGSPEGLYNVAAMNGPACIKVFAGGAVTATAFTYVVPEIGLLVAHNGKPPPDGPYEGCVAQAVQGKNHRVVLTAGHCVEGADDFAFAPGYFGAGLGQCGSPAGGSSSFFSCGTAPPYGIWCAKTKATTGRSPDPLCGTTTSRSSVEVSKECCGPEDFAFLAMAPSSKGCPTGAPGTRLGFCLGGELAIPWKPGRSPAGAANQGWSVFGYTNSYLNTCRVQPTSGDGSAKAGTLFVGDAGALVPHATVCPWITFGDSGGAWINGQNGATYGIGAINKAINDHGLLGTYMGSDARAVWRRAQSFR
jgi:hypothetical protein